MRALSWLLLGALAAATTPARAETTASPALPVDELLFGSPADAAPPARGQDLQDWIVDPAPLPEPALFSPTRELFEDVLQTESLTPNP